MLTNEVINRLMIHPKEKFRKDILDGYVIIGTDPSGDIKQTKYLTNGSFIGVNYTDLNIHDIWRKVM